MAKRKQSKENKSRCGDSQRKEERQSYGPGRQPSYVEEGRRSSSGRSQTSYKPEPETDEQASGESMGMMTGRWVTGVFDTADQAERCYNNLRMRFNFSADEITLLMSDETRSRLYGQGMGQTERGSKVLEGLGVGGAVGVTIGAIVAGLAAIGTNLLLPGLGLVVAGPLAAALAGAGVGGVAGGLIGSLVGAGIPEERAQECERHVREGRVVIGVRARDERQATDLEQAFMDCGAREVKG